MMLSINSGGHFALVFLRGAGDAAGEYFALLVQEFFQELGVFVVDVLDAVFLETAVLLLLNLYRGRG